MKEKKQKEKPSAASEEMTALPTPASMSLAEKNNLLRAKATVIEIANSHPYPQRIRDLVYFQQSAMQADLNRLTDEFQHREADIKLQYFNRVLELIKPNVEEN